MEDSSPFYSGGAEFKAPTTDSEEETTLEPGKKKKKNRLSQLWAKLFDKETDQPKEEQKGFMEAFGTFFSKLTGVEKNELDEPAEPGATEAVVTTPDVRFPFLGAIETSPYDNEGNQIDTENTPGTAPEEQPVASSVEEGELPIPHHETTTHEGHSPDGDMQGYNETDYQYGHDAGRDTGEPQEALQAATEANNVPPDRIVEYNMPISPDMDIQEQRGEPVIKERETVIEQRGGAGAALLGAIVANRLSKSRDRKIQAEAKQLEKKVEKLQKAEKRDAYEIERLRVKSQQQAAELRNKRETAPRAPQNKPEMATDTSPNIVSKPERAPFEAKTTMQMPEVPQSQAEVRQDYHSPSEVERYEVGRRPELDPVVLEQVEHAAEQNIALERYFERRHEVKDVPTNNTGQGGADLGGRTTQAHVQDFATQANQQLAQLEQQQRMALKTQQAYKKAATQGVVAGIIMLVSFALIAFIWSLLN